MLFNIIGLGNLGKNITAALINNGYTLQGVCSLNSDKAHEYLNQIQQGIWYPSVCSMPWAPLTLIATPDDAIECIVTQLSHAKNKPSTYTLHLSGALASDILEPLRAKGSITASMHPLKSFTQQCVHQDNFKQCFMIIEGQFEAQNLLKKLVQDLDAIPILIQSASKGYYHAAAVIASNYVYTLAYFARQMLTELSFPQAIAQSMVAGLMSSCVAQFAKEDKAMHLTGPLVRDDYKTIQRHLKALENSTMKSVYQQMGLMSLPILPLSDERKKMYESLFRNDVIPS